MLSFDDYLTNRIKLGKSQYIAFLILSLIEFMAGFQEIFQAILVRLLAKEWGISIDQQALLGVLFFTGIMIGNIFCSLMADRIGRRLILIWSQSFSVLMMLFNSLSQNYFQAAIMIFFYGIVFGVSMPISQVMASEIAPVKVRGRFLVMLQFIYILGILHLIIQCQIFLESLDKGDWRTLIRFNILIPLLCLILSKLFLIESPRLSISKGNFVVGFALMNQMGKMNDPNYEDITLAEQRAIEEWNKFQTSENKKSANILDLFRKPVIRITIFILLIFVFYNIVSCGIIIVTPFLLGEANKSFFDLFYAYLIEIPAICFVLLLFENKRWGGRIKCTIYGLVIMTIIQILLVILKYQIITIGIVFIRFSFRIVWSGLNALPAESFATRLRTLGVGTAHGTGKLAGAISSIATLPLFYYSAFLPFIFGSILSFLCICILLIYPVDATQQALDLQIDPHAIDKNTDQNENSHELKQF